METDLCILVRHQQAHDFDLMKAIAEIGIRYIERPLPAPESGRIIRDGSSFTIIVNSKLNAGRRRFSAAHQLAHYIMHRDLLPADASPHISQIFEDNPEESPDSRLPAFREKFAKQVAVQIFLPAEPIRTHHRDGETTEQLAARYKTTPAAMAIRLRTLSLPAQ